MAGNELAIAGVLAEDLAETYGTPLYVYDEDIIKQRFSALKKAIAYPDKKLYYACKANGNVEILKIFKALGADGIDAVSIGEAKLAVAAGFTTQQVSLTNPSLSEEQMRWLHERGVEVKIDSIAQLRRWLACNGDGVWIRVNPGVGLGHHEHVVTGGPKSKFGIYPEELDKARSIARVTGVHQHAGSGSPDMEAFLATLPALYEAASRFPDLEALNIGGGLGIPYAPDERAMDPDAFGRALSESFAAFCESYGRELTLCLEPGRYFVAESGYLLARVTAVKQSSERRFAVVDTGFNHLIRPVLYASHHAVVNASRLEGESERLWVGGNVCESGDLLTDEREITKVREGDLLALLNAGAYGYCMASNYTGATLPAEVLVSAGKHRLIRERREIC